MIRDVRIKEISTHELVPGMLLIKRSYCELVICCTVDQHSASYVALTNRGGIIKFFELPHNLQTIVV
jgi:hypothetical protein